MDEPFDIAPKLETLLLALLLRCNGVEISPELQLQTLLLTLLIKFEITPHLQASREQFNDDGPEIPGGESTDPADEDEPDPTIDAIDCDDDDNGDQDNDAPASEPESSEPESSEPESSEPESSEPESSEPDSSEPELSEPESSEPESSEPESSEPESSEPESSEPESSEPESRGTFVPELREPLVPDLSGPPELLTGNGTHNAPTTRIATIRKKPRVARSRTRTTRVAHPRNGTTRMDRTWAFARIVTKNHTGSSELTGHGSQRAPTTRIAIANHAATKHKLTEPYAEGETIAAATGEVAETGEVTPMDAPTAGEKVDVASGEAPTTTMKVEPPDECGPSAAGEQVAVSTGEVAETGEATPMDAPTACEQVAATSDKAIDTTARVTYTSTAAATGEIAETGEATPMDAPTACEKVYTRTAPQIPQVDCQYEATGWRAMQPGDSPQRGRESVRATNMVEINDNRVWQEVVDKELRNRATTDHQPHRIRNIGSEENIWWGKMTNSISATVLWRKGSNGGMILQGQCVTEILRERRDVTVSDRSKC
jgi:hypothetical protein